MVTIDCIKVIEVWPLNAQQENACYQQMFFMATSLCHSLVRYTFGGLYRSGAGTYGHVPGQRNVKPEARVITDTHLSYKGLDTEFMGHATVNHSEMEFRNGIAYTNSVEGFLPILNAPYLGYTTKSAQNIYNNIAQKQPIVTILVRFQIEIDSI